MNPAAQSRIVANLKKYTKYEFFIAPFYKTVEGQPSNSKIAQTFEDGKLLDSTFAVDRCICNEKALSPFKSW